jgi:simple sugar transport system ATP-binding protein
MSAPEAPILSFSKISKRFGTKWAIQNVSFDVQKGHIHALIGENGAGKSTIMKILFGFHQPTAGEIFLNGKLYESKNPQVARHCGIGMVHQHFMLAGPIPALDHILLEDPAFSPLSAKPLPRAEVQKKLETLSEKYKMPVPWIEKIENLSVGIQQRIEILKLLYHGSDILIFDEPTAVLTPQEIESFLNQLRELKSQGKTIILITHKLKEVLAVADQITVFRKGAHVGTFAAAGQSSQSLAEKMVGHHIEPPSSSIQPDESSALLEIKDLTAKSAHDATVKKLSLQIHKREIVGIAGIEGHGQLNLIYSLITPQFLESCSGEILFQKQSLLSKSTAERRHLGFGIMAPDRLRQSVAADMTCVENFLIGQEDRPEFTKLSFLNLTQIQTETDKAYRDFDIQPVDSSMAFKSLSGGNQQKLVAARELLRHPPFLIAAQPTRGVDIGAIETIHKSLLSLKNQGSGILLISSDLSELLQLSDRIAVMFEGRIVKVFDRKDFDESRIGLYMTRGVE